MDHISYEAPKVAVLGSVEALTAGQATGAADGNGGSTNEKITAP